VAIKNENWLLAVGRNLERKKKNDLYVLCLKLKHIGVREMFGSVMEKVTLR
jgi:hypothetical protein